LLTLEMTGACHPDWKHIVIPTVVEESFIIRSLDYARDDICYRKEMLKQVQHDGLLIQHDGLLIQHDGVLNQHDKGELT